MNAQTIKAKTSKTAKTAKTAKTVRAVKAAEVDEAQGDISSGAEELEEPKTKLTGKEKTFARLDELYAGLYEDESDSEWEDADSYEEDVEEASEEERKKIDEMVEEAKMIAENMINDLDDMIEDPKPVIKSLEKEVTKMTEEIYYLKDEVDELKELDEDDRSENELKEKKKELAKMRKALRTTKASIKEKKECISDYKKYKEEKTKIEAELFMFESMAAYFNTVEDLIRYATSYVDEFSAFFAPFNCKNDLLRSLFFNDTYDVPYTTCVDMDTPLDFSNLRIEEEYEEYRITNGMSAPECSVSQLEWDEIYESLGEEHYEYTGYISNKLNMKQLKFLCVYNNIPRDGKKSDIIERLNSPYELYVPKSKRTEPFDTFAIADPNQEKYDELMKDKSYYKNSTTMKILRQRKIMGCQLMRATKAEIKYIFSELGLEIPKGKHEDLVKKLIEHYHKIF